MIWKLTRPLRVLRYRWRRWRGTVTVDQQVAIVFDVPEKLIRKERSYYDRYKDYQDAFAEHLLTYQRELLAQALHHYKEKTGSFDMLD